MMGKTSQLAKIVRIVLSSVFVIFTVEVNCHVVKNIIPRGIGMLTVICWSTRDQIKQFACEILEAHSARSLSLENNVWLLLIDCLRILVGD